MDAAQMAQFEKILNSKLLAVAKREAELEHNLLHTPDGSEDHVLATDMGAENLPKDVGFKLVEEEVRDLQEIEDALLRIKDGVYGICEECEEDIPIRRLEVLPEARYCVSCESEFEKEIHDHEKGQREVDFDHPIIPKRK